MSKSDQTTLAVFRKYRIGPGKMLCFHGLELAKHGDSLRRLTERGLLNKERFKGGYSLTSSGFAAMRSGEDQ